MIIHNNRKKRLGRELATNFFEKLPGELHLPGYQYCGPGTKLAKRLSRGDPRMNPLDAACEEHDIDCSKNQNIEQADKNLAEKAWQRVLAKHSSVGKEINAFIVATAMKLKRKTGLGIAKRKKAPTKRSRTKVVTASLDKIIGMAS